MTARATLNDKFIKFVVSQAYKRQDDDFIQVGRIAIWKNREKLDKVRDRKEREALAATVIKCAIVDHLRAQKPAGTRGRKKRFKEKFSYVDVYDTSIEVDPDYDSMIYLHQVIDRGCEMDARHQAVISMYAVGSTLAEIGQHLNVTEGRACQMLRHARNYMRD